MVMISYEWLVELQILPTQGWRRISQLLFHAGPSAASSGNGLMVLGWGGV
jgi:hypothetical protein